MTIPRKHRWWFASTGLMPLAAMQLCLGQTQNQSESTAANRISVTVNAVLVPVVVRDAQGNAVGDLKKGDFEVFDKNKPQVIVGFDVQWVFAPAVCNGQPNEEKETFVVHFHGR